MVSPRTIAPVPANRPVRFTEIGSTGLDTMGGRIYEEFHRDLRGPKGAKKLREFADNSSAVGAFRLLLESLISQAEWRFRPPPGKDSPQHLEAADFAETCRKDLSYSSDGGVSLGWGDFVADAIIGTALYGFSIHETWYKVRAGDSPVGTFADEYERARHTSGYNDRRLGWGGFEPRAQDSLDKWGMDASGSRAVSFIQRTRTGGTATLPLSKCVHLRFRHTKNNPEGFSFLRPAYPDFYRVSNLYDIMMTGMERDLVGLGTYQVPERITYPNASAEERAVYEAAKKMIQGVRRNAYEGLVIPSETREDGTPSGFKLSLLATGGARQHDIAGAIAKGETRILRTLLSEITDLGSGGNPGSFAMSDTKKQILAYFAYMVLSSFAESFDRIHTPRLMTLNGFDREFWPVLTYGEIDQPDLAPTANYLAQLKGAGIITPDINLERWARERGGLPPAMAPQERPAIEPQPPEPPTAPEEA